MLKYEHLRIFIPQSDGTDSRNQHPKLHTVKWDVDAIANLSHYLSQRTHIGQYSFCTLKKNTSANKPEEGNMIIVGSDARPLKANDKRASSLSAYIREKAQLAKADISTGENLLHSHMEIERCNKKDGHCWIYKGFVSYSDEHYHGIFSQIAYPECYACAVPDSLDAGVIQRNPIVCIQGKRQNEGVKKTAEMPWKPCTLKGLSVKQKQLAQLLLWRDVDKEHKKIWFRVSMVGASGPATMALSTLLVNESVRKKAFGLLEGKQDLSEEQKKRLQDMGHPLSDLQQTIREKLVAYFIQKIDETIKEKPELKSILDYERFLSQVKHAAVLYLNGVLYRYFLPFLSLEDEKKLTNGMHYYLSCLYASRILTEPQVDQQASEEECMKQEEKIQKIVSAILDSVEKALETVMKNFRGIEAMYEVEVEITGETNSDSRKLLDISPYKSEGKNYVNCLSVQEKVSSGPDTEKAETLMVNTDGEKSDDMVAENDRNKNLDRREVDTENPVNTENPEAEETLTVNLHGRESIYKVIANILDNNIDNNGKIVSICDKENEIPSIFDFLCADEKESEDVDEKAVAVLS